MSEYKIIFWPRGLASPKHLRLMRDLRKMLRKAQKKQKRALIAAQRGEGV